ncbi:response regulator [Klebsiella pneumoniae]|nr:response regulator [Klebsiella pneumoniae]
MAIYRGNILIIEFDIILAGLISKYLEIDGYTTNIITCINQIIPLIKKTRPNLIVFEVMMSENMGLRLLQRINMDFNIPVIVATSKTDEIDRLIGFELGAEDYLCKPYSPRELVARIKAILRRYKRDNEYVNFEHMLCGRLIIIQDTNVVKWGSKSVVLTPKELVLLKILANKPGRVFTYDELIHELYKNKKRVSQATIKSHLKHLRFKLKSVDANRSFIRYVFRSGYCWDSDYLRVL